MRLRAIAWAKMAQEVGSCVRMGRHRGETLMTLMALYDTDEAGDAHSKREHHGVSGLHPFAQ